MKHILLSTLVLLGACRFEPRSHDAYWSGPVCVRSHTETRFSNECGMAITGHFDCAPRLRNHRVCDEYGPPVCRPGSDGVADCTVSPEEGEQR